MIDKAVTTSGVAAAAAGPFRPVVFITNLRPLFPCSIEGPASFLIGTALQTEMAVTYRKQTTAHFLTGARIAHWRVPAQLSNSRFSPVFPSPISSFNELIGGSNL